MQHTHSLTPEWTSRRCWTCVICGEFVLLEPRLEHRLLRVELPTRVKGLYNYVCGECLPAWKASWDVLKAELGVGLHPWGYAKCGACGRSFEPRRGALIREMGGKEAGLCPEHANVLRAHVYFVRQVRGLGGANGEARAGEAEEAAQDAAGGSGDAGADGSA